MQKIKEKLLIPFSRHIRKMARIGNQEGCRKLIWYMMALNNPRRLNGNFTIIIARIEPTLTFPNPVFLTTAPTDARRLFSRMGGIFKQIYTTSSEGTSRTCDITLHDTAPHQHNNPLRVGGLIPQLLTATYRFP